MTSPNKAQPSSLVARLAKPTAAYRRHAWLAVAALAMFMLLYLGLAAWFLFTAWRLTLGSQAGSGNAFWGWIIGGCAAFLAVFMLKAIFFVSHGSSSGTLEITAAEQPRLFEFLHKLADRAGAPRPHKVFVSARVNAAVFYDLSVLNLVLPSRKNLEIGLGLVNAVTLGELRAVLAHEFGHFAQKSMAVGRWVYVAQQIAGHLVARRDKLDDFLRALSRFDVRVAWVGWLLGVIVWAIRSLVDSAFSVVVMVQRALSREMEMQADLVAVSLTGSDALVHALHKLQAADDSWDRTLGFVSGEHAKGRLPRDAFAVQSRVMQRMGQVLNDPQYHRVPPLPSERPQQHRLFKAELAQPPRMWLTHPLNHEREANAKRHYVAAPIDDRSAWEVFDAPDLLRERLTALLLADAQAKDPQKAQAPVPMADTLQALDAQFDRESLDGRYRGIYLGRSITRSVSLPAELADANGPADPLASLDALYPESLLGEIERLRALERELAQLKALKSGALSAPDGQIRHRERSVGRGELPQLVAQVERELRQVEQGLLAHDKACRSVHRALARQLGGGWEAYLDGLLALLHYADHGEANLRDAQGLLANTWQVESATRRVGKAGVERLLGVANALQASLRRLHDQRDRVVLDALMRERVQMASWSEMLGEFALPPATREQLGDWLEVVDSWVGQLAGACGRLRAQALDQLLHTEAVLARRAQAAPGGTDSADDGLPVQAPPPSSVPAGFETLQPGRERERQTRLGWAARFQTADGLLPAAGPPGRGRRHHRRGAGPGRLGGRCERGGLQRAGRAGRGVAGRPPRSGGRARAAAPQRAGRAQLPHRDEGCQGRAGRVLRRRRTGQLRHLCLQRRVRGAAGAMDGRVRPHRTPCPSTCWGAPRWSSTAVDHVFEDPPRSISTKGGGGQRSVLQGLADADPQRQLALVSDEAQRRQMLSAHLRWDPTGSRHAVEWFALSGIDAAFAPLLQARLDATPDDVVLLRAQQDGSRGEAHAAVCARQVARSQAQPDNPSLSYAAVRCGGEGPSKWQALHRRPPALAHARVVRLRRGLQRTRPATLGAGPVRAGRRTPATARPGRSHRARRGPGAAAAEAGRCRSHGRAGPDLGLAARAARAGAGPQRRRARAHRICAAGAGRHRRRGAQRAGFARTRGPHGAVGRRVRRCERGGHRPGAGRRARPRRRWRHGLGGCGAGGSARSRHRALRRDGGPVGAGRRRADAALHRAVCARRATWRWPSACCTSCRSSGAARPARPVSCCWGAMRRPSGARPRRRLLFADERPYFAS